MLMMSIIKRVCTVCIIMLIKREVIVTRVASSVIFVASIGIDINADTFEKYD